MIQKRNETIRKKVDLRIAAIGRAACHSKCQWLLLCICFWLFSADMQAQYKPATMTLQPGEKVNYEVYFKWGFIMSRAGDASLSFNRAYYKAQNAFLYRLNFRTVKLFESIYKMRDTIDCYYNTNYSLLYSSKRSNEDNYYLIDELTFSYPNNYQTSIYSHRYTPTKVKIDTTLTVKSGYTFDMLGAIFFLRTLNWANLKSGNSYPLTVTIGKDLVKMSYRYNGQATIEHDGAKYKTHYFMIDIYDEAFTQSKAAAELWVGDDENHLPIKVRSKLKIGYAEIHYKSSSGLKAPLNCRVTTK